jgi:hypothetical protein
MDSALLALSQQSGIRVLFSYDLIAAAAIARPFTTAMRWTS